MSQRCFNCGISLDNHRLKRTVIVDLPNHVGEVLNSWFDPSVDVPPDGLVCKECTNLLEEQHATGQVQRDLGHRSVCLGCGMSVLRVSHLSIKNDVQRDIVMSWVSTDVEVHHLEEMCRKCWTRMKRTLQSHDHTTDLVVKEEREEEEAEEVAQSNEEEFDVEMLVSDLKQDVNQDKVIEYELVLPPPPSPPPRTEPARAAHNPVPSITLPNYKRLAATSRSCMFHNCGGGRLLVPKVIKQRLLLDYRLYIPRHARICSQHLESHDWEKLLRQNTLNTFTSIQVEDMLNQSAAGTKATIDFKNINNMDPRLLYYWIGCTADQLNEMLLQEPSLSHTLQSKAKTALCMYLVKRRSGDSNERLASLFKESRSTFERKIKIVGECFKCEHV